MANRFNIVAIGTNDESSIVVRVILGVQTKRTIVFATSCHGRAIERRPL